MAEQMAPPAPEGAPAAGGGEDAVDKLGELITNVSEGMTMLNDVVGSIDPAAGEKLAALSAEFQSMMSSLGQGGGQAPAGQGQVSMEAGASKAVPMSPAGIPRGR